MTELIEADGYMVPWANQVELYLPTPVSYPQAWLPQTIFITPFLHNVLLALSAFQSLIDHFLPCLFSSVSLKNCYYRISLSLGPILYF